MKRFNTKSVLHRTDCSPKFAETSEEERRIDSKLVKLKLGKIMEVIQTPRIAELLDVVRQTKAAHLYDKAPNSGQIPKGYNQLMPLDELMRKVGSFMA